MKSATHPARLALSAGLIVFLVAASCQLGSSVSNPPQVSPTAEAVQALPSPTQAPAGPTVESPPVVTPSPIPPTAEEQPSPAAPTAQSKPQASQVCDVDDCVLDGYFLLRRPVGAGGRNTIDVSNRFGRYQSRTRDVHHGEDFLNSTGTSVVAAADGEVVVAGDDSRTAYALQTNTYGNLVVIKHELPGVSEPIFTLYGQLSEVRVKVKDEVKAGQEIGLVGSSGRVTGSTLHFEVRWGENAFGAVRNPELWLQPLPDENGQPQGAIAGRVLDAQGRYVQVSNIVVERLGGPGQPAIDQIYIKSYAEKRLLGLDPLKENFALGDLPEGSYQVSFWLHGLQQKIVKVKSGKLTYVNFQLQ